MFKDKSGLKNRRSVNPRINDHAYVSPGNGKDCCKYENCRMPKLAHEWTVGASQANPAIPVA